MTTLTLGQMLHSFFIDYLPVTKGLRPSSIASYRDGMRLFLRFVAQDAGGTVVTLPVSALTADRVLAFLRTLEADRHNHVRTRNHRLAMLRTFFTYVGDRVPECVATAERVVRMPTKRVPPPETCYLDRSEVEALFARLPSGTWAAERDRTLLLVLYNTGARVQEAADLRVGHLQLQDRPCVRLHGKECHAYCISFRPRDETTGTHAGRQACDLAFSAADVLPVVRRGIGVDPYTNALGASRVVPMSEPWAA